MRQGKKPTRKQKEIIKQKKLNLENWLVVEQTNERLLLMHRHTGRTKEIVLKA